MELPQSSNSRKPRPAPRAVPRPKKESSGASCSKKPILKQLHRYKDTESQETECLLCTECFSLPQNIEGFLSHLLCSHHLVIADIHCIADFKGYIDYWRPKMSLANLSEVCTVMHAPVKEVGTNHHIEGEIQEFFLLSDVLPEDCALRQSYQKQRLEWVLQTQQFEREDTNFKRGCLICRTQISGTRATYLQHLSDAHNIQLGRADNLVFVDELIDLIEQYLEKFQCIYCEKFFTDRLVLREHMRKKMHKRINPGNHLFDQYYAVNYLEMGKNWQQVADEKEGTDLGGYTSGSEAADGDVADWDDWNEATTMTVTCLLCDAQCDQWEATIQHLKQEHRFDFHAVVGHLDFYQKVKLVNYIRNQVDEKACIVCQQKFVNGVDLLLHMDTDNHNRLPDTELWDRAEYYFPTKEDDEFLCQLDDGRADDEGTPDCVTGEEPDVQLREAFVAGRLSEVIELKAELCQPLPLTVNTSNSGTNKSESTHHVKFKDVEEQGK